MLSSSLMGGEEVLAFSVFRILHICSGFLALLIFWIPLVTKKGRKVHRTVGWIYVWAMAIVSLSAFYMGAYRVLFDETAAHELISFSWFLIFISILSGATAWYGIRVLHFKQRKERHRHIFDLFVSSLLVGSGVGISLYGFSINSPLIAYFPLLGIFIGVLQLLYWLRKPSQRMHWYYEHFGGMIPCCIATVTAFTVFGAPRLLNIETTSIFLWFLPTILLVPVLIGFQIYYNNKFSKSF